MHENPVPGGGGPMLQWQKRHQFGIGHGTMSVQNLDLHRPPDSFRHTSGQMNQATLWVDTAALSPQS